MFLHLRIFFPRVLLQYFRLFFSFKKSTFYYFKFSFQYFFLLFIENIHLCFTTWKSKHQIIVPIKTFFDSVQLSWVSQCFSIFAWFSSRTIYSWFIRRRELSCFIDKTPSLLIRNLELFMLQLNTEQSVNHLLNVFISQEKYNRQFINKTRGK